MFLICSTHRVMLIQARRPPCANDEVVRMAWGRFGLGSLGDDQPIEFWMNDQNDQVAQRDALGAAGRGRWDASTRSGENLDASRPTDVVALGGVPRPSAPAGAVEDPRLGSLLLQHDNARAAARRARAADDQFQARFGAGQNVWTGQLVGASPPARRPSPAEPLPSQGQPWWETNAASSAIRVGRLAAESGDSGARSLHLKWRRTNPGSASAYEKQPSVRSACVPTGKWRRLRFTECA